MQQEQRIKGKGRYVRGISLNFKTHGTLVRNISKMYKILFIWENPNKKITKTKYHDNN